MVSSSTEVALRMVESSFLPAKAPVDTPRKTTVSSSRRLMIME
jgi:hypothetical protein